MKQPALFDDLNPLPPGFIYRADFLTTEEESWLLEHISTLALHEARYKEYTAKRRIISYGGMYDFSANELVPAGPIPEFLHALCDRVGDWAGVPASRFAHALIAEYSPGTQLGWHRDVPEFELVAGISLSGPARMRFRPYPPKDPRQATHLFIELAPRSAYIMRGEARWKWQHSIAPTRVRRYSITFRTRRGKEE